MTCPRCGEKFGTHERWASLMWTAQGTKVEGYTYLCSDCRDELLVWAGVIAPVPEPPITCQDERLLIQSSYEYHDRRGT